MVDGLTDLMGNGETRLLSRRHALVIEFQEHPIELFCKQISILAKSAEQIMNVYTFWY